MQILDPLFFFILAISIVVGFHEFGHYLAARMSGVKVDTFSIGMGPKLLSWKSKRSDITYQFSAFPIGGYVKMWESTWLSDHLKRPPTDSEMARCFDKSTVLRRFFVVANGPFFNFVLAVVGYAIISQATVMTTKPVVGDILPGSAFAASDIRTGDVFTSINGKEVHDWEKVVLTLTISSSSIEYIPVSVLRDAELINFEVPMDDVAITRDENAFDAFGFYPIHVSGTNRVTDVLSDSVAFKAGVVEGDRIVSISGCTTPNLQSIISCLQKSPEGRVNLAIEREGEHLELSALLDDSKALGITTESLSKPEHFIATEKTGYLESLQAGLAKAVSVTSFTVDSIYKLATGSLSPELIGGPVVLAKAADSSADHGLLTFINFLCIFSVSLMVLNLLPIPPLDGGHLFLNVVEVVGGEKVANQMAPALSKIGIVLVGLLMLFAIGNDIFHEIL